MEIVVLMARGAILWLTTLVVLRGTMEPFDLAVNLMIGGALEPALRKRGFCTVEMATAAMSPWRWHAS